MMLKLSLQGVDRVMHSSISVYTVCKPVSPQTHVMQNFSTFIYSQTCTILVYREPSNNFLRKHSAVIYRTTNHTSNAVRRVNGPIYPSTLREYYPNVHAMSLPAPSTHSTQHTVLGFIAILIYRVNLSTSPVVVNILKKIIY